MKYCFLTFFIFLFLSCGDDNTPDDNTPEENISSNLPNILLIIADDMGKDATNGFSEGSIKPNTPNLDELKNAGVSFNNFWAYPTCSPTRASIITGKYGYRTNVKTANDELSQSEKILQKYISEETNNTYSTAIIGKWHLSGENSTVNPESLGMDYYAGLIRGGVQDYYSWQLTEGGSSSMETQYITEALTDLSKDWINNQTKPWFLWLAYNAPHTPFHVPPSEMHSQGNLPAYENGSDPMPYYMAAIEALDYQVGKLLREYMTIDELNNTIIIFMGDNGTPNQVAQSPYEDNKAKGSLYQGGINVPLFVSGKQVVRRGEDNNLITSTDLFSTIANLAGIEDTEIHDSKSFKSLFDNESTHREFQYSEKDDGTNGLWTISNGEYKLIVNANGQEEMYDLGNDPYENINLLEGILTSTQVNAKAVLEQELTIIRN